MSLAVPEDVETSLMRDLTQTEQKYVQALLERAENLLLVRINDLNERSKHDTAFRDLAAATEGEAVARVFRNPAALQQESEGNYSYSVNFQVASGLLDILDAEWERLGENKTVGSIAPIVDGYAAARWRL